MNFFKSSDKISLFIIFNFGESKFFFKTSTNFLSISTAKTFFDCFNNSLVIKPVPAPISSMFLFFGTNFKILLIDFSSIIKFWPNFLFGRNLYLIKKEERLSLRDPTFTFCSNSWKIFIKSPKILLIILKFYLNFLLHLFLILLLHKLIYHF